MGCSSWVKSEVLKQILDQFVEFHWDLQACMSERSANAIYSIAIAF